MTAWAFGMKGVIVEHDPATGLPLEGGKRIRCTACQFHLNGDTEVVAEEFMAFTKPRFGRDGFAVTWRGAWYEGKEPEYRWKLMTPEEAEAL